MSKRSQEELLNDGMTAALLNTAGWLSADSERSACVRETSRNFASGQQLHGTQGIPRDIKVQHDRLFKGASNPIEVSPQQSACRVRDAAGEIKARGPPRWPSSRSAGDTACILTLSHPNLPDDGATASKLRCFPSRRKPEAAEKGQDSAGVAGGGSDRSSQLSAPRPAFDGHGG